MDGSRPELMAQLKVPERAWATTRLKEEVDNKVTEALLWSKLLSGNLGMSMSTPKTGFQLVVCT